MVKIYKITKLFYNKQIKMKINTDPQKIESIISRGVDQIIDKNSVLNKLFSGKRLVIKHGIDPTSPNIHLGHSIILLKLKEFQELGHKIILIVGDFTAKIGDPSGRTEARKILSDEEIKNNLKNYKKQISKILDIKKTEIVYNNSYLKNLRVGELIKIASIFSVNQILERDMFKERQKQKKPIWLNEFLYPLFQGYDSVKIKADIEIGGSDQLFNMLIGREMQKFFNQKPQDVITMKILIGKDGRKMSKSFDNYIAINDSPLDKYGKIMSIKDELIFDYLELCTRISLEKISELKKMVQDKMINPVKVKKILAKEIVKMYHGENLSNFAQKEFEKIFKEKKQPSDLPEIRLANKKVNVLDFLVNSRLCFSKSEAKRLIMQKGVKIDDKLIEKWKEDILLKSGSIVQVGKKKFVKIV
jgi:tyrosyl-tRNA synthetase